jgi:hypothetical protein
MLLFVGGYAGFFAADAGIRDAGGQTGFVVETIERTGSSIEMLGVDDLDAQPEPSQLAELDVFAMRLKTLARRRGLRR